MRCSRTRGKKGLKNFDPDDPPRCRANKRRGRGTFDNDRPPMLGMMGRETGAIRLRAVQTYEKSDAVSVCGAVHAARQLGAYRQI